MSVVLSRIVVIWVTSCPQFLLELNRGERRCFEQLFTACEDFLTLSEELVDEAERESEWDGQPDEAQEWADFDPDC